MNASGIEYKVIYNYGDKMNPFRIYERAYSHTRCKAQYADFQSCLFWLARNAH